MNKWIIRNKFTDNTFGLPRLKEILLSNRGISGTCDIGKFISPVLDDLRPEKIPMDIKAMDNASKRIMKAKKDNERVIVYTDYDADGICAGAIVWEMLYEMGIKVWPYIPDRVKEGYGLSKIGMDYILKKYQPSLLITVDHGISASECIGYLISKGVDVIVLDHHVLPRTLPPASSVIHTTVLSAGGIALLFSRFLHEKYTSKKQNFKNLDLAAIATISDLMPLRGPNRIIAKFGLRELNHTRRLGLKALIKEAGLTYGDIGTYEVSHIIAPRINAAGRMTHGIEALRLICTKDMMKAVQLAENISGVNRDRQLITEEAYISALQLLKNCGNELKKVIFISDESFKEGVIGLIAGKLVDEFSRPAIVVCEREIYCKASARSVQGFDIIESLRRFSEILVDIGGHPMAAGFTVEKKNLDLLKKSFCEYTESRLNSNHFDKNIEIDAALDFQMIDRKLLSMIKEFEPFGTGNPQPVFCSRGISVVEGRTVGKEGKHLKLKLAKKNQHNGNYSWDYPVFDSIGFGMGKFLADLDKETLLDIAYIVENNNWNGKNQLQLKLKDVIIH